MPFCPLCGSEFRAGFSECNTCQVPLVAKLSPAMSGGDDFEEDEMDAIDIELKLLTGTTSSSQASIVRRLLDEAGIPSIVQGGHGDEIGSGEPYQIFVDENWYDDARASIEAYMSPGLVTGQIEGDLQRLEKELVSLERGHSHLKPQLGAVKSSLQQLQKELEQLNRELD